MPSAVQKPKTGSKPWKALYRGKWYIVESVDDPGVQGKPNIYHLKGIGPVTKIEDLDIAASTEGEMDKEHIYKIIAARYNDKDQKTLESIAADVFYSGEPAAVLASGDLLDKLFLRFEQKQVEGKKAAGVDSNTFCPICKMSTAMVKLANDVPARWCSRHFVVFPVKTEG